MGVLSALRTSVFGPKTVQLCDITNPCPNCDATGVKAEMYLDSDGNPEMMVVKCPKCGPVKKLYAGHRNRPQPRFEKSFWEWRTGDEANLKKVTSKKKEV